MMENIYSKWVACWGTATSIADQQLCRYAKDITLRYPIRICFNGSQLRFHFSNLTGTEPVTMEAYVAHYLYGKKIDAATSTKITVGDKERFTIEPGDHVVSDEIQFSVSAGKNIAISIYLPECTQMNAGTYVSGPLSKGYYCYGNQASQGDLPLDLCRNTNWYYFLNTIDVMTEPSNRCIICYGDSITAQSWPDYLAMRCWNEGHRDTAIIRRAVCGTRILRQYDCITYQAYGLKGATRFPIEAQAAGCETIIIQHGINDIIHPVGHNTNVFRPWSDLPTVKDMEEGYTRLYIEDARARGLKVWGGTLVPIYNWRTYEQFREDMKNEFNDWLLHEAPLDGIVDFNAAVRDPEKPERFKEGFDSGDHLHPSEKAYAAMAAAVPIDAM